MNYIKDKLQKTRYIYHGEAVYEDSKRYYYLDFIHGDHIEVFRKSDGKHLGEIDPITGKLDTSKADSKKKI